MGRSDSVFPTFFGGGRFSNCQHNKKYFNEVGVPPFFFICSKTFVIGSMHNEHFKKLPCISCGRKKENKQREHDEMSRVQICFETGSGTV